MLNKLQEIDLLLDRAGEHLKWLRKYAIHPDPNLIPEKAGYYISPESGDIYTGTIRIVIGEFASSLRNALNYLTCALTEQDSGRVGKKVQFPIESSPKGFWYHRDTYLEGIRDEHLALFERFQPYRATDENWIGLLRDLSNWYRHNGLIRVEKVFQRPKVPTTPAQTERRGLFTVEVRRDFTFAVSLPDGRPVIQTLEKLLLRVREAIKEFEAMLHLD
jgi:hypothetical protein